MISTVTTDSYMEAKIKVWLLLRRNEETCLLKKYNTYKPGVYQTNIVYSQETPQYDGAMMSYRSTLNLFIKFFM